MPYFLLYNHLLLHDIQISAINLLCHLTLRGTAGLELNFRGGKLIQRGQQGGGKLENESQRVLRYRA